MPAERKIFGEDHRIFRDAVARFMEREVVPYHDQWEKDGVVSRDVWLTSSRRTSRPTARKS